MGVEHLQRHQPLNDISGGAVHFDGHLQVGLADLLVARARSGSQLRTDTIEQVAVTG